MMAVHKQEASVLHIHDPELLVPAVFYRWLSGVALVYDVHENVTAQVLHKSWIPGFLRRFISVLYARIERLCLRLVDEVILAEEAYAKLYETWKSVTVIRNYPLLDYASRHCGKPSASTPHGIRAIYVGGISKHRGILELIEAWRLLKGRVGSDVTLHVVGKISEDLRVASTIQRYGLDDMVSFLGPVQHREVYSLLAKSDVGVAILHPIPNYLESLPTKLYEYMAAGLPVIASNFPLWKEIVEGNGCGLTVDPLDPEEIARAIEYLLAYPEEAQRMGENGRRAVKDRYNWESEAKKLTALYERILA